ncbi:conjugal transfer protein [Kitasatospora sp. NPDC057904]|uniref:conjugal transfer protein n=1 Tax=Kitasatospora sp. NPDC057904 TaxID=3346275 RepID=UPI0036DE4DDC
MRFLSKHSPTLAEEHLGTAVAEDGDAKDGGVEAGGWSTGARANSVVLVRWAAWCLLLLGPVLGVAAWFSMPAPTAAGRPQAQPGLPATGSQGAAGFAQLFVAAFISAGDGDQARLAAYFPAASGLRLEGTPGRRSGEQLAVVRLRQTDRDVWSVTVAARITGAIGSPGAAPSADGRRDPKVEAAVASAAAVHYFQVPVAAVPSGGGVMGYVALAMPAEVSAPPRAQAPVLVYGPVRPALPGDARTQAVAAFLASYLTGAGELDRYLAPGVRLEAVAPVPYTAVVVDQLAVEGERGGEGAGAVPADGVRARLLVVLRATGHDGVRVPLTYALTLSSRAGRWEIASLDGAPSEALDPAPSGPATTS